MIITSPPPPWMCLSGNAQLFITNPNPETAFFHKKRQTPTPTTHFTDTHLNLCISSCILTPPHSPSPPALFLGIFCSLMHLKLFIIFCFIYHDFRCDKCLPFQLCSSWKVLSPWRGDIFLFTPTPLPLPPSLPQDEFLKSGANNYVT